MQALLFSFHFWAATWEALADTLQFQKSVTKNMVSTIAQNEWK